MANEAAPPHCVAGSSEGTDPSAMLAESSRRIDQLDLSDLSAVQQALQLRGCVVAAAASTASPETLAAALQAGDRLRDRLLAARRDLILESARTTLLKEYL